MENEQKKLSKLKLGLGFALASSVLPVHLGCSGGGGEKKEQPKPPPPQPTKLVMSNPSYNDTTKLITWNVVPNANGYRVQLVQNGNVIDIENVNVPQYEVLEPQSGQYTANVTARGNGTTYLDSDPKSTTFSYTKEQIVNPDPYNEKGALMNAINNVCETIVGRNLTEAEQAQKSDEMKAAFVDGFARDEYSKYIPFTSEEIRRGYIRSEYKFSLTTTSHYSPGGSNGISTMHIATFNRPVSAMVISTLHETGHHFGLEESLTELLKNKYIDANMSPNDSTSRLDYLLYSPFFDNLLLNRVGGEKFWNTVFRSQSPNADYGKMWDENMTVTVDGKKEVLTSFHDMQTARAMSMLERDRTYSEESEKIVSSFENLAGITDIKLEFIKMGAIFENALVGNDQVAIKQIQDFFTLLNNFEKNNSGALWQTRAIEDVTVRDFIARISAIAKSAAPTVNVNLQKHDDEIMR